jgi:glycosyltransferase involved in cell wall biosynthesis
MCATRLARTQTDRQHSGIGYAYPHWKAGRVEYAMDVIGLGLAESMSRHHHVELFAPGEDPGQAGYDVRKPFTPLDRRIGRLAKRVRANEPSRPVASTIWPYLGYSASVSAAARHLDVMHVHIYDQLVPPIRRLAPDTKVVLHMHDHSQTQRRLETVVKHLAMCDVIVGCSEYVTRCAQERFPQLADRMTAIPNATVVGDSASPVPESKTIVFVGRISPEKGVHVLASAFRIVHERVPDARLVLVGPRSPAPREFVDPFRDDPLFDEVDHVWGARRYTDFVIEALGDAVDATEFTGGVTHDATGALIESATVLAMPSVWDEPFGMPVIEAMARGRPVVATRGGAFPEVVDDGVTGRLVDKGDVDRLADALVELLSDRVAAQRMGEGGHRRARQRFSWDRYVEDWDELYSTLTV